ncbi:MAG: D-arabinono-1,4-lactone oxidase [Actinomycetota bacterium]
MSEETAEEPQARDGAEPAVWTNWSGRLTVPEGRLVHVRTQADAAAVAARAAGDGMTVRVAGAGHSHAPLVPNRTVVDVSALSGVLDVDVERHEASIAAGTPIHAIGPALHRHGLSLRNQGDIDRQLLGGAVATGTHGTGVTLGNFSSAVVGARLATAGGDLVDCSADTEPDLWRAARLNLGALGIVTELRLSVRPAHRLRERAEVVTFDEMRADLDHLGNSARHAEFFWYPVSDRVILKRIDETDDEPVYPLASEGRRVAWSYEVLPNHRTWPHTEMEYSVSLADGPACLDAIRELLATDFPAMDWPVEYRTLAADDVWLSTAYERPTVTISLHLPVGDDERRMYEAAEAVFAAFGGRPHWGKVHYLGGDELAARHPAWDRWWAVRDGVDPDGVFLNDHLRAIRP